MPTYDLSCVGCDHEFEAFRQGFLRDEDRVCPSCGNNEAKQRFTGFVTAKPSRGAGGPTSITTFGNPGGGCCGGVCGGH